MDTKKDFLSVTEAAEILGLKLPSVRDICKEGRLPGAEKIGSVWVIPHESVLNYRSLRQKRKEARMAAAD
jgi:excisionase family DNA binding protein